MDKYLKLIYLIKTTTHTKSNKQLYDLHKFSEAGVMNA